MPLYGSLQPGGVLTALQPGDRLSLFDGTEAPAALMTSIAFERAPGPTMGADSGVTFTIAFGVAPTNSLLIQGSNRDVEAEYQTLYTSTNKQWDNFTDTSRLRFYRAKLNTYSGGTSLVVTAQR